MVNAHYGVKCTIYPSGLSNKQYRLTSNKAKPHRCVTENSQMGRDDGQIWHGVFSIDQWSMLISYMDVQTLAEDWTGWTEKFLSKICRVQVLFGWGKVRLPCDWGLSNSFAGFPGQSYGKGSKLWRPSSLWYTESNIEIGIPYLVYKHYLHRLSVWPHHANIKCNEYMYVMRHDPL